MEKKKKKKRAVRRKHSALAKREKKYLKRSLSVRPFTGLGQSKVVLRWP